MLLLSNNQWKNDYNRPAWEERGEDCSAEVRVEGLVRAYKQILPDMIGLQEVSVHMADLMMDRMRTFQDEHGETVHYEYLSGGDTPIVFRSDRFLLMESGFLRYPKEIPGLTGEYNNAWTKSYTYGVFQCIETGKMLIFMSTHLWWMSSDPQAKHYMPASNQARAWQLRLASRTVQELVEKYQCPAVIVGDFNAGMGSLCLDAAAELGWKELHDLAADDAERDNTRGHHPCGPEGWTRNEAGVFAQSIDHMMLLNGEGVRVHTFRRLTDTWYDPISDHYPLYSEISL